jgi:regulator of G-protein signaling
LGFLYFTVEAIHLANLLCQHGYFFPVGDNRAFSVKDDSSLYRFQVGGFVKNSCAMRIVGGLSRQIKGFHPNSCICDILSLQTPYYWPSQLPSMDTVDYAIYLAKRTLRNKQKHGLDDYEVEAFNDLRKNLNQKWDFISMQADEQVIFS